MNIIMGLVVIISSSIIIYLAGKKFAETSSTISNYFNLPKDVKGATFDAVSSSLPELLVGLYSVIIFKQFEVGIGTIAGSALFNLLVIPAICVFAAPVAFKVSKKVITRDALFYMITVFLLIILLIYFKTWGLVIALILLFTYLIYLKKIIKHVKIYQKKNKNTPKKINIQKEFINFFFLIILIGIFTYLLTSSAISISKILGISSIIIAFTIIAAATSVPDTVISVINARKGSIDDATSNIFGSNIFNISIGIGLPLLIYFIFKGAVGIAFTNIEIVLGLLGSTIIILYFFGDNHKLSKKQAAILLLIYLAFIIYTVLLTIF